MQQELTPSPTRRSSDAGPAKPADIIDVSHLHKTYGRTVAVRFFRRE